MPSFKPPVYSKVTNAKGQTEPSYVFPIEFKADEDTLETIAENSTDLSVAAIEKLLRENKTWWDHFLVSFLQQSAKFFSKSYPVDEIRKVIRHSTGDIPEINEPSTAIFVPDHIRILGGIFTVKWTITYRPIMIDIPGLTDPLPDLDEISTAVAELNIDELPLDPTESVELDDPNKLYQKQKVKAAILKAKVAYYRAQNHIRNFSEKYGDEYSDSEFELEDTENESEESGSEEEDQ